MNTLTKPANETVAFIVRLQARPEERERMRTMLFDVVDAMAKEPDFINTWVHEDQAEPNTVVLYETWACSRETFMARHLSKPYRQAYEAALPELLAAERTITFLTELRAYPGRTES
ncbi:antibiotic biosynthesis monooxygenase [Rugamonas sp.]|uniref:putative quinol monooxygenase n=1 Tax=Rugamonas sp. TaxID=1926287 RepID=UPI0025F8D056|nr:antibiotic biosynthesis monooxygenase [Rugamonas sp.]